MGGSMAMGVPKMVYRENPTKMDDLGVPPYQETSICSLLRYSCFFLVSIMRYLSNHPVWVLGVFFQLPGPENDVMQISCPHGDGLSISPSYPYLL